MPTPTPERRWGRFWAIVGGIAGVVGAAAAVYPLVYMEQQFVHLTLDEDWLRMQTLSEPVILTGNWNVRRTRGRWPLRDAIEFERGRDPFNVIGDIEQKRVFTNANERAFLTIVRHWPAVEHCGPRAGQFEFGMEFKSKAGLGWAYTRLPYCTRPESSPLGSSTAYVARADVYAAKGEHRSAIDDYTKAMEMSGGQAAIYFKRGVAYEAIDQPFLATDDFRQALGIDPTHQPSKDGLTRRGASP